MTIQLSVDDIRKCFKKKHQLEVLNALCALAIPALELVEKVDGYPRCSQSTFDYIAKLFAHYDKRHHPNVQPGGMWMSRGWEVAESIPDFHVSTDHLKILYYVG